MACDDFIAIPLHQQMPDRGQIVEYGGNRDAILNAIPALIAELDLKEFYCYIPSHDLEFLYLLEARGIPSSCSYSPMGTYKILNLPRLMQRLRPHLECRLRKEEIDRLIVDQVQGDSRENDRFIFRNGEHELVTSEVEQLVFGFGEKTKLQTQSQELASMLHRIFPLPLIWHGLNLV